MFLGTPHRGANLASLLGNLLSASFSQRKYVTQLQVDSELIKIINAQFRDRAQDLELVSFHESTEMRGIGVNHIAFNSLIHFSSLFPKIRRSLVSVVNYHRR